MHEGKISELSQKIDELKDEGYEYDDPKTEEEFINEVNNILN